MAAPAIALHVEERVGHDLELRIVPPPSARRRRVDRWLVALFAVLNVVMTFPQPWRITTHIAGDGGDALFLVWTMRWVNHALVRDWSRLWHPPIYTPTPDVLAYSDTLLPIAPVFGVLEALTGSTALAFNVVYLSAWTLGTWCTYRLALRLVGVRSAAVLAAVAFTYASPHLTQYRHLQLVVGGLLPGVLLLALRFAERPGARRGAALATAVSTLTLVASYYGLAAAVCAVIVLAITLPRRGIEWRPVVLGIATAAVVGAALLAPFAAKFADVTSDPAMRRRPDPQFYAIPSDLVAVSHDNRVVRELWPLAGNTVGRTSENHLFPGYVAIVLGAAGLAVAVRRGVRRETVALLAAAATCAVLAFGDTATIGDREVALPFSFLRDHVPGFDGIRVPARFLLVGVLGVAILAALGAAEIRRRAPRAIALPVLAALVAVVLVESSVSIETVRVEPRRAGVAVNEALASREAGTVVELPMRTSVDGAAWPFVEVSRQLAATVDWLPRLNGHSGFEPPGNPELARAVNAFPAPEALDALDRHEVRYVVIRTAPPIDIGRQRGAIYGAAGVGAVSREAATWMIAAIPPARVRAVEELGDAFLVELAPRE